MLKLLQVPDTTDVAAPLRVTVPWVMPKFSPLIVTVVPMGPPFGEIPVMIGPEAEETAKGAPLLGMPPTVTTIFPLVALLGTRTVTLVLLQVPGATGIAVPLRVTMLPF